ncbi:MAG TPA: hypothetical protein VKY19_27125 [Ktedonosporobacter sp.]|nr:hypothetical protein [Ktedonosporobacter sp.]
MPMNPFLRPERPGCFPHGIVHRPHWGGMGDGEHRHRASARHCPYPSDPVTIHHRGHRHRAARVMGQRQGVWVGATPTMNRGATGCPAVTGSSPQ